MSKVIRLDPTVYDRLAKHRVGFETPSQTIKRILDKLEKEDK